MKKNVLLIVISFVSVLSYGQKVDYNLQKGYVAGGYDVVSYFDNDATKGKSNLIVDYDAAKFKFSSQSNLDKFKVNPSKYIPQYGGWCAYALATKNEKVEVNPTTFEIRNGKLYLFYNKFFDNTLESWLEEMPDKLVKTANINWSKIKYGN